MADLVPPAPAAAQSDASAKPSSLFRWSRVEDHLSSAVRLDNDLLSFDALFPEPLTPLPSQVSKIAMDEPFDAGKYLENIVCNFLDQNATLRYSTWKAIKWIYDAVENEATPNNQKILQLLLILSKLSADEFYYWHNGRIHEKMPSAFYDKYLLEPTVNILSNSLSDDDAISRVDNKYAVVIKAFLRQRAIVMALSEGLEKVGLPQSDDWIRRKIDDDMHISFTDRLFQVTDFNGFTLLDGILLVTNRKKLDSLLVSDDEVDDDSIEDKAKLFTVACHETGHFLARVAAGDFNFSSPGKGQLELTLRDEEYPDKALELGRYVELRLFGGIQPSWRKSKPQAASDFIKNSKLLDKPLPLIQQQVHDQFYLVERFIPSLSFAGDLDDPEFEI